MSKQPRMSAADFRRDRLVDMTEDELLRDVRQLAKKRRWSEYHTHRSDRSPVGFPDLVLARRGEVVFAELKAVTGHWGEGQREWLAELAGDSPEDWHFDRTVYAQPPFRTTVGCWTPLSWDYINQLLR